MNNIQILYIYFNCTKFMFKNIMFSVVKIFLKSHWSCNAPAILKHVFQYTHGIFDVLLRSEEMSREIVDNLRFHKVFGIHCGSFAWPTIQPCRLHACDHLQFHRLQPILSRFSCLFETLVFGTWRYDDRTQGEKES